MNTNPNSPTPTLDRLAFHVHLFLQSLTRLDYAPDGEIRRRIVDGAVRQSGTKNRLGSLLVEIAEDLDSTTTSPLNIGTHSTLIATLGSVHGFNRDWPTLILEIAEAPNWNAALSAAGHPLIRLDWRHQYSVLALLLRDDRSVLRDMGIEQRLQAWAAWAVQGEAGSIASSVPPGPPPAVGLDQVTLLGDTL